MIQDNHAESHQINNWRRYFLLLTVLLMVTLSCNFLASEDEGSSDLQQTEIALGVEQTMVARQEANATLTAQAPQLGGEAGGGEAAPTIETQPTDLPPEGAPEATAAQAPTEPPPPTTPAEDFNNMMKSASILLYEDIINDLEVQRYIKDTLDGMGLNYNDVGSAKGRFKDALLSGAPGGQPWDLIIVGAESRGGIQGEFFEYINNSLDRGSSVILEVWHLDQIFLGKAQLFLQKCGADIKNYSGNYRDPGDHSIFPINGADHPILKEPHTGISFTQGFTYFWPASDLGDLMYLNGSGDGQLLMGREPNNPNSAGVLAVCDGGKLVLQTFSSHSFVEDIMRRQWENYIHYALRIRLLGGP